ncbi:MAG: winged helix-turn-helix domain-containing protein [Myxococcales bacterium]|nr:winged helix-turn-helix domain-containing protein [Myxococcales bacterium]
MNAILSVLRTSQSALFIEELDRRAIEAMALPADVAQVPHDPARPDRTEVAYRMAWARTYLKKANLLANPARGMWALTEQGRSAGTIDAYAVASSIAQARDASGLSDFETEEFLDGLEDDSTTSSVSSSANCAHSISGSPSMGGSWTHRRQRVATRCSASGSGLAC